MNEEHAARIPISRLCWWSDLTLQADLSQCLQSALPEFQSADDRYLWERRQAERVYRRRLDDLFASPPLFPSDRRTAIELAFQTIFGDFLLNLLFAAGDKVLDTIKDPDLALESFNVECAKIEPALVLAMMPVAIRRICLGFVDLGFEPDPLEINLKRHCSEVVLDAKQDFSDKLWEWEEAALEGVEEALCVQPQAATSEAVVDDESTCRQTALLSYKRDVKAFRGNVLSDEEFAKAACLKWNTRTPVVKWKAGGGTAADDAKIRAVLTNKPHLQK